MGLLALFSIRSLFLHYKADPVDLAIRFETVDQSVATGSARAQSEQLFCCCDPRRSHTASVMSFMQQLLLSFCAKIPASKDSFHLQESSRFAHHILADLQRKALAGSPHAEPHSR